MRRSRHASVHFSPLVNSPDPIVIGQLLFGRPIRVTAITANWKLDWWNELLSRGALHSEQDL